MQVTDTDSAEKTRPRSGWSGTGVLLATPILSLLLFLREPGHFFNPQFWAEDGSVFFMQSYEEGFLRSLATPISGYLHTLPRIVAGLALLFPLTSTPLIFNLAALAIQALPIPYLLSRRLAGYLPNPGLRMLAAALYVAAPNSYETYVNLTNSQWNLAFFGLLLLLAERPTGRWLPAAELALLAVFAVTGPFGVFLLPCGVLHLIERKRDAGKGWWIAQSAVLAAGTVVQVGVMLTTARSTAGVGPDLSVTLREGLHIISTHVFYDSVLGIHRTLEAHWATHWAAQLAGLIVVALLAVFVALQRHRALLCLLYLSCVTILLSFLFPLNDLKLWLKPDFGPRYYFYATLFMLYATILLCLRGGWLRWLGAPLALAILTVGIPGDFRHIGLRPNTQWVDQVSVFENLPRGASLYVPLLPVEHGGITMRKKTPGRAASPLDGLRKLSGDPAHTFDRPFFTQLGNEQFLRLTGWVANTLDSWGTGRVWLIVDGRPYPAVVVRAPDNRSTSFLRDIPMSEMRMGRHRIFLVLLTRDGTGYCPTPEKKFSLVIDGPGVVTTDVR